MVLVTKVLVAGFGNLLRQDDGFGVALLKRLQTRPAPPGVTLQEVGIGGVSMVQELLTGYDALIVLDALDGSAPGTVKVLEAVVPEAADLPRDFLADTHYAEPGRAMVLAKAVGALPRATYVVGCVAERAELGEGLSAAVTRALERAEQQVLDLIGDLVGGSGNDPDFPIQAVEGRA